MSLFRLFLRNLVHFRGANAAVIAGMAVATAVLVGALLVGDSVRGSLRQLVSNRLGPVDYALISPLPFNVSLADRLGEQPGFTAEVGRATFARPTAGLFVKGGAADVPDDPDALPRRAGDVQIVALTGWPSVIDVPPGECVLNGRLADELGVRQGDRVMLSMPRMSNVPLDAPLARRDRGDVLARLPLTVARVDRGGRFVDLFSLAPSQRSPRNVWVNLADLQESLGQPGRANVIFVSGPEGAKANSRGRKPPELAEKSDEPRMGESGDGSAISLHGVNYLNALLPAVLTLDDLGLSLRSAREIVAESASAQAATSAPDDAILQSRFTFLHPAVLAAAEGAAATRNIPIRQVSVNLADKVAASTLRPDIHPATVTERTIHYAIVAGVSDLPAELGASIGDANIVVNAWTANELDVLLGGASEIAFSFYRRQPDGGVKLLDSGPFTVDRVLPMTGLGADRTLVPSFEGLTDRSRISDWRPPTDITIKDELVTDADEKYWEDYQAAPKLFVSLDTARRLWGDATFGLLTSIRVPATRAEQFRSEFLRQFDPASLGLKFIDIREAQLLTASGPTDFAMLFIGFSFFIIVAAVLLVALLFRLGIEQRARQIGLLGAIGFDRRRLLKLHLAEGAVLAIVGGIVGAAGGVAYCHAMIAALRTWWLPAVGTTALTLHVSPTSLAVGLIAGVAIAMLAIVGGVRWAVRTPPAALLAGNAGNALPYAACGGFVSRLNETNRAGESRLAATRSPDEVGTKGSSPADARTCGPAAKRLDGGRADCLAAMPKARATAPGALLLLLCIVCLVAAVALIAAGGSLSVNGAVVFMSAGFLLMTAAILGLAGRWRSGPKRSAGWVGRGGLFRLAFRNAGRHPMRSVLAVALLAFASFVLVVVASMRSDAGRGRHPRSTGAFDLMITSDVPLTGDLNTAAGRKQVGIRDAGDAIWSQARFTQLRRRAGQDASCRNMTYPASPTILGVPQEMIDRGRFEFDGMVARVANPWTLLDQPQPDNAVPVIADAAAAEYSLHLAVGQTLKIRDDFGSEIPLRLVATLKGSMFQGELLVSEKMFRERIAPGRGGFGMILVEAPADRVDELRARLAGDLGELGVTVDRPRELLAEYAQVANTYLSTFESLGGLGLLLGTVGLSVVLVRSVLERRRELALLAAIGFGPGRRLLLVLAENVWLLALGFGIGTTATIVALLPILIGEQQSSINIGSLAITLMGIAATGLAALTLSAAAVGRRFAPADLRVE